MARPLAAVAVLAMLALGLMSCDSSPPPAPPPPATAAPSPSPTPAPVPVSVETVRPGTLARVVSGAGRLEPGFVAVVKAPRDARVVDVLAKVGQKVDAGVPLVTLSTAAAPRPSPVAATSGADAAGEAERTIRVAENEVHEVQAEETQAQADLDDARKAYQASQTDLSAEKQLLDSGAIARDEYDTHLQESQAAKARLDDATAHLQQLADTLGRKQEALAAARQLRDHLSGMAAVTATAPLSGADPATSIPSPHEGVLAAVLVKPGTAVKAGTPIVRLVDDSWLQMTATVQAAQVPPGALVEISGKGWKAPVTANLADAHAGPKGVTVSCPVPNVSGDHAPGPVTVKVVLDKHEQVLSVHRSALVQVGGARGVWTIPSGGEGTTVMFMPVETGLSNPERVEIVHGLEPGDVVVWRTGGELTQGATVLPLAAGAPSGSPAATEVPSGSPAAAEVPSGSPAAVAVPSGSPPPKPRARPVPSLHRPHPAASTVPDEVIPVPPPSP